MNKETNMTKTAYETFASLGLNGQEGRVENIKTIAGHLFDAINGISIEPNAPGARCVATAKTKLEETVMWAVKGVSRSKADN